MRKSIRNRLTIAFIGLSVGPVLLVGIILSIQNFNTILITAGIIVIASLISSSLGFLMAQQIIHPIQTITKTAQKIGDGDLSQKVQITDQDEFGLLGYALNNITAQWKQKLENLEQSTAKQAEELSRTSEKLRSHTTLLEIGSGVSKIATTSTDPQQLIRQAIELIRNRFNLYYVSFFLVDDENRYVVLQHGTGEAGRMMMESAYRLKIGDDSMVSWVCTNKEARIALDVGKDAVHFANPLLPDTHSEMVIPLRMGERIVGALDLQS